MKMALMLKEERGNGFLHTGLLWVEAAGSHLERGKSD